MVEKITKKIGSSFEENIDYMDRILPVDESFDIIRRQSGDWREGCGLLFHRRFCKRRDDVKADDLFYRHNQGEHAGDASAFSKKCVPYVEVDVLGDFDQVVRNVLSGASVLFVDGYQAASASTAAHIRRGAWMSRTKINLCGAPGTDLWRPWS